MDPGPQRRRSADARVQPDQAAPAPLQHPPQGRQELSLPGRHPRRRVAPGHGHARHQAQGRALLRSLRPRLRHPRDPRPAAAHLPHPHLLGQQAGPAPEARAPVPAVPHREVLGAVRGRDRPGRLRRAGGRADRLPGRRHRRHRGPARDRDARGGRRARVRAGRPAARPTGRRAQGHRQAADGGGQGRGRRRDRHRRGRPRGGGAGLLRPPRPGGGPQGLRRSTRWRTSRPASWSTRCWRASTTTRRPWACPSRCWCRSIRPTPTSTSAG